MATILQQGMEERSLELKLNLSSLMTTASLRVTKTEFVKFDDNSSLRVTKTECVKFDDNSSLQGNMSGQATVSLGREECEGSDSAPS